MNINICRICLDRTGTVSVFGKEDDLPYSVKIMRCVKIDIKESDGLPNMICKNCVNDLSISYDFIQRCEASDKILRVTLSPDILDEIHPNIEKDIREESSDQLNLYDLLADTINSNREEDIIEEKRKKNVRKNLTCRKGQDEKELDDQHTNCYNLLADNSLLLADIINFDREEDMSEEKGTKNIDKSLSHRKIQEEKELVDQHNNCYNILADNNLLLAHTISSEKEENKNKRKIKKNFRKSLKCRQNEEENELADQHNKSYNLLADNNLLLTDTINSDKQKVINKEKRVRNVRKSLRCRENQEENELADMHNNCFNLLANIINSDRQENINKEKEKKNVRKGSTCRKMKQSKIEPIQCVICGLLTTCPSALITHMRTHTGEKPFTCPFCQSKYSTKGALKRHHDTHHVERERKFICETCGNRFFRKSDIVTHMRIHTDEKPYFCPFCSRQFRQVASLIRHKRTHTGEKPFSCDICDKKFADKNLVRKHQSVHSNERKFSCHFCFKAMKSKTALNTHLGLHTNEKQNVCSFCGAAFSMKGNLQTHIRRVHSEKSGECTVCLKAFSDLEVHMRKHTGEKPFICVICSRAFAAKRNLTHHMVFKHENAAKFKCLIENCNKTFPTATMLEFHLLKQHTNNIPYSCQYCSRGFYRTSDLSRHLRISHLDEHIKNPSLKSLNT